MQCETCHGKGTYHNNLLNENMPCIDCNGSGIMSCCDTAGIYWPKDPDEELINEIALLFFDSMNVPCEPSSYAKAVIKKVRDHDAEKRGV